MAAMWSPQGANLLASWRDRAECRSAEPGLFFPIGTTQAANRQLEAAKAVCRRCPVQEPCLEFALRTRQDAGVWGGWSEDERQDERRARRRRLAG